MKMITKFKDFLFEYNQFDDDVESIQDFTETSEFKEWFGNSKIVDKDGKPLPLYHGSPVGSIESFQNKDNRGSKGKDNIVSSSGLKEYGIFFTTNLNLAQRYKQERKLTPNFIEEIKVDIFKLKEKRDNVRNNREYDELNYEISKLEHKLRGGVYQTYLKMENPYIFDAKGKDGYDGWKELKVDLGYKTAIGSNAIEALSGNNDVYKSKYDGIIAKNNVDLHLGGDDVSKYREYYGDVYIVFSPSQTMIEKEL